MATVTFDTHKAIKELESAGFTEDQAVAVVSVQSQRLAGIDNDANATKSDVKELKDAIHTMQVELRDMELRLIRWLVGSVGIGLGIAFAIFRLMK